MYHDVVIAGASIAGLVCAREIAAGNHDVLVIEEDGEIGTPEHCGGLVSMSGLADLGIIPLGKAHGHQIESARIFAPDGDSFAVDIRGQNVVEINRRELDKQVAFQAQKRGAMIKVRTGFRNVTAGGIMTSNGEIGCRIFVDARGVPSLVQKDRTGIFPSAQYEVYAGWIRKREIQVHIDQERFPGFFAWVIPSDDGRGRVGVAGREINAMRVLDKFLEARRHTVIRKIYAPVWIKGAVESFVDGNTVTVGDAAGQAKPTTAGGIYSGGMGGLFAGRAISQFLLTGRRTALSEYQERWRGRFGKEFERQLVARGIMERISNSTINKMCKSMTVENKNEISKMADFDFHAGVIARLLGLRGSIEALQAATPGELKDLVKSLMRGIVRPDGR